MGGEKEGGKRRWGGREEEGERGSTQGEDRKEMGGWREGREGREMGGAEEKKRRRAAGGCGCMERGGWGQRRWLETGGDREGDGQGAGGRATVTVGERGVGGGCVGGGGEEGE